jgi:hypothetical protein
VSPQLALSIATGIMRHDVAAKKNRLTALCVTFVGIQSFKR